MTTENDDQALSGREVRRHIMSQLSGKEIGLANLDRELTIDLIRAIKLPAASRNRLFDYSSRRGRGMPRIKDFRAVFPEFPLYVTIGGPYVAKVCGKLSMLLCSDKIWTAGPVVDFYSCLSRHKVEIADRPVVFLVHWPGMKGTMMLHQIPYDAEIPGASLRFISAGKPIERLSLESVGRLGAILKSYGIVDV